MNLNWIARFTPIMLKRSSQSYIYRFMIWQLPRGWNKNSHWFILSIIFSIMYKSRIKSSSLINTPSGHLSSRPHTILIHWTNSFNKYQPWLSGLVTFLRLKGRELESRFRENLNVGFFIAFNIIGSHSTFQK